MCRTLENNADPPAYLNLKWLYACWKWRKNVQLLLLSFISSQHLSCTKICNRYRLNENVNNNKKHLSNLSTKPMHSLINLTTTRHNKLLHISDPQKSAKNRECAIIDVDPIEMSVFIPWTASTPIVLKIMPNFGSANVKDGFSSFHNIQSSVTLLIHSGMPLTYCKCELNLWLWILRLLNLRREGWS